MACGTSTTFLVLILLDRQQNKKKKKKKNGFVFSSQLISHNGLFFCFFTTLSAISFLSQVGRVKNIALD